MGEETEKLMAAEWERYYFRLIKPIFTPNKSRIFHQTLSFEDHAETRNKLKMMVQGERAEVENRQTQHGDCYACGVGK